MAAKSGNNMRFTVTSKETRRKEGTVFMAIDTSGSMAGDKIQEVSSAVKDIILQCPYYVRFVIRKFDMNVTTIVSKKKKYLDIDRLLGELKMCGHRTALYDGIGQTINEIPYSYSQLDVTHVLAFTDGCDNASKNYTLDSMINLLNQKTRFGNLQFTFIQAGNDSTVTNALEAQCTKQCTVLKVEDSVKGIKMGFAKARQKIKHSFVVTLPSNESLLQDMGKLQISGLPGGSVSVNINPRKQICRTNILPVMDFSYARPLPSCLPTISYPHLAHLHSPPSFCQPLVQPPTLNNFSNLNVTPNGQGSNRRENSKKKNDALPKTTSSNAEQKTLGCSSSKKEKKIKSNVHEKEKSQPSQSAANENDKVKKDTGSAVTSSFLIWAGNIPKRAKEPDILEFFTQWGDCNVYRVEELKECRCAVISYSDEKASQLAVKYGNDNSFLGSEMKLKVFKY